MNDVLRQEKKLLVTRQEMGLFAGKLAKVLRADPHNGPAGYAIRSLYFDTLDDGDFWEKIDGVEVRRKLRLRCYGPGDGTAKLELKQKQGEYQRKRSLTVCRADAEALCRGDYRPLLGLGDPFAAECYSLLCAGCYRPRALVEYRRLAFVARENETRLTFDSEVRATESCFDLFSPALCLYPVLDPWQVVLEVKYNGFLLGYIQDLLAGVDRRTLSVSKYALSRSAVYGAL